MMPRLNIDFARRRAGLPRAGVTLLSVALAMLMLVGHGMWLAYEDHERARGELDDLTHRVSVHKPHDRAVSTPAAQLAAKQSRVILSELTVPWQDLLAIVEGYPGHDVALIGIDQNPMQAQIRITAEAKDFDAMVGYLKYLQSSALLREAALNTHLVETTVPGMPVRFQITAMWRKP